MVMIRTIYFLTMVSTQKITQKGDLQTHLGNFFVHILLTLCFCFVICLEETVISSCNNIDLMHTLRNQNKIQCPAPPSTNNDKGNGAALGWRTQKENKRHTEVAEASCEGLVMDIKITIEIEFRYDFESRVLFKLCLF